MTRDSAGVSVVEIGRAVLDDLPEHSVEGEPVVSIGAADGAPEEAFGSILAVRRLSDGSVVVADRQLNEVRLFDAAGAFVATIVRPGDGPGEVRRVTALEVLAGDTVAIYDGGNHRLVLYTPGRGDMLSLPPEVRWPLIEPLGVMSGRELVARRRPRGIGGGRPVGRYNDSIRVLLITPDSVREVIDLGGNEVIAEEHRRPDGGYSRSESGITIAHADAAANRIVHGEPSERHGFDLYDLSGALRLSVRIDAPRPSAPRFTKGDLRRMVGDQVDEVAELRDLDDPDTITFPGGPDALPYYSELHVWRDGAVWLGGIGLGGGDDPGRSIFAPMGQAFGWLAFDPEGRPSAVYRLPPGLRLHEVAHGFVTGVEMDRSGVERVVVYRIEGD